MREVRGHSAIDEREASVDKRCVIFFSAGMNIYIKVDVAQIHLAVSDGRSIQIPLVL